MTTTTSPIQEYQLSREIWAGAIPIKLSIYKEDVTSSTVPDPVYFLINRMSYLTVFTSDLLDHFGHILPEMNKEIWFEYKGAPLRGHLPVGVIFDSVFNLVDDNLPWDVIVHVQGFPHEKILHCSSSEDSHRYFSHSIKQAVYLLSNSTSSYVDLGKENQSKLWNAACTGNRGLFEQIGRSLRPAIENVRLLPIRTLLVIRDNQCGSQKQIQVQVNIAPVFNAGKDSPSDAPAPITMWDVLLAVQQRIHDQQLLRKVGVAGAQEGDGDVNPALSEVALRKATVQGVNVPPESPAYDIWRLFSHADLFLYIVISADPTE